LTTSILLTYSVSSFSIFMTSMFSIRIIYLRICPFDIFWGGWIVSDIVESSFMKYTPGKKINPLKILRSSSLERISSCVCVWFFSVDSCLLHWHYQYIELYSSLSKSFLLECLVTSN
jgi:hypothetical protein